MIYELKNLTPPWLEPLLIQGWYSLRPMTRACFGGTRNFCPLCESGVRLFLPHKWSRRHLRVVCPVCFSHTRHRQAWLFLKQKTNLFDASPKRLLHFAPETMLVEKFRALPGLDYLSTDLDSPHAMAHMDITALDCEAESFDAVYCSHVLEHVPDDRKAMAEIHRVLRPGGWALVQVPLSTDATQEDPSITDPRERQRLYGQRDHVRFYGLDIVERLEAAGFAVQTVKGADLASNEDCQRYGFLPAAALLFCKKATR
jgi:SAM-dependent methyltransferase